MEKVLVICGPTATGKTSLALKIANLLDNVSIISADSRQAYQDLDIISGKDIPSNLPSNIRIFGLNLFSPDHSSNLAEYTNFARNTISHELQENRYVIIVGGTGLYLKGITEELSDISIPNDEKLRNELSTLSVQELQKKLQDIDDKSFSKLNNSDKNNSRRLIRHIEISLNQDKVVRLSPVPEAEYIWVGLNSKSNNVELIKKRVVERLKNGAINEVSNLLLEYPDTSLPIYSSLGVKEIMDFQNNKISESDLIDKWTKSEENYAKRQMVWFKKQPGIIWYDETTDKNELASKLAQKLKQNA